VQIWAQGGGKFEAVSYQGGLPGAGWDGDRSTVTKTNGQRGEGEKTAIFTVKDGTLKAEVNGQSILVSNTDGVRVMELNRTDRSSPTSVRTAAGKRRGALRWQGSEPFSEFACR
jgi:hypothetical protein